MLRIFCRCVEEKDKPIAMGFGMTMGSLCAFIPSPILFGIILGKDADAPTNVPGIKYTYMCTYLIIRIKTKLI
jgi:hypothetical protein